MQTFDINIPINATRNIDAQGDYFSYYAGSAGGSDPTLLLSHDVSGSTIQVKPGQAVHLPKGQKGGLWRLKNYANQATISGTVVIGSGQIDDHTVTGIVQTVDGELAISKTGMAYTATGAWGGNAGVVGMLEMWNSANSGVRSIVTDIMFSSNVATTYILDRTAALVGATLGAQSKLAGAPASKTLCGLISAATDPGTRLELAFCNASEAPLMRQFKQPYIIMPGSGLVIASSTIGSQAYYAAQFTEEGI